MLIGHKFLCKKCHQASLFETRLSTLQYGENWQSTRNAEEDIFKRWAKRPAICYEPERKVQADSDRSDIRVFETGLSTQQYGDNRQSTRTAEEEECLRLIKIAKEQGLYIDKSDWGKFGDRRMIPTGESIVFLSEDGTTFTKVKSPFAKAPMKHILPEDIIYEHLIHNILFPSTRYRFVGFSEDIKGIRIVLQQRNISDMFRC